MINSQQAQDIVSRGGGLILDAGDYDPAELQAIAKRAALGRGIVILRRCGGLAPTTVTDIVSRSEGRVILDFSD